MPKTFVKTAAVLLIAALVIAYFVLDVERYLTLQSLKEQKHALDQYYQSSPSRVVAIYAAVYILTTGLSLPGAALLTLAGGTVFGFWMGLLVVSFASTIGATCSFLAARFLLRDAIQGRFGDSLRRINGGVEQEGSFYLFTLRLIPVFPYFVVNVAMALTPIRTQAFFIVSQIGMLPGTAAYVNAGTQLGQITSLKGILSTETILSFAALGLVPLISKKIIDRIRRKRRTKVFKVPSRFDYNVVIIGGGSAGLVSSYIAATVRAKVALIEKHRMGGECLNTGCVPSKALIRTAKLLHDVKHAQYYGVQRAELDCDFADVMERVQRVIRKVEPHDSTERYTSLGVECINGQATIRTPYEVAVGGRILTTKSIIVATGARPVIPKIVGLDNVPHCTSETIWGLRTCPKRLLVLGGGPVGCELGQAFQRLGSQVTIVEMADRILSTEDTDAATFITGRFEKEGVTILTSHKAKQFMSQGDGHALICEHNAKDVQVRFDVVLLALGREAAVKGFGLEELGVDISDQGTITADDFMRTNYPNIYVCGDVAGPYQFTHVAAHQAWYAAINALFSPFKAFRADYRAIPWATFTDPEVARVGLNETDARQKGIPYEVTHYAIDDLDRAIIESEDHGFVKVLTVPRKDKILGVTIVGARSSEYIAEFVAAMKHGFGLKKILGTVHIYPTFAEANKYAAGWWWQTRAPERLFRFFKKMHEWRR